MRYFTGLLTVLLLCVAGTAAAADLAITGAKVYPAPDAAPVADAVILIRDGRIVRVGTKAETAVPPGYEVLERPGAVVTAGFWNSHVHLITPELLKPGTLADADLVRILETMFSKWGFTTVFDIASTLEGTNTIRRRIKAAALPAPRILTVGDPFYPKGGTPVYALRFYRDFGLPPAEITTIAEAVARLRRQIEGGADGVKLFTGAIVGGETGVLPMPAGQVRTLTEEAHRLGRQVFAHPTNRAGLDVAVNNGVDILAHAAPDAGEWDAALVKRLKARKVALIPTLTLFHEAFGSEAEAMAVALQQVKALAEAGGEILFGTDGGFIDTYDTAGEFRLMATAMDWRAILASLTTAPARRFGEAAARGRVAAGFAADLVILDGDPAADVTAFARVRETIRAGRIIYRRDETAARD